MRDNGVALTLCHSMHRKFHDGNVSISIDDPYLSPRSRKDRESCGTETRNDWMAIQHGRGFGWDHNGRRWYVVVSQKGVKRGLTLLGMRFSLQTREIIADSSK
jgi:hypothetical protein